MSQLVVLNLGKGDWDHGCPLVTVQLWSADSFAPMQINGALPTAPEFGWLYPRWQRLYEALYAHRGWRRFRTNAFEIEDDEAYLTDVSEAEFQSICQQLHTRLNAWLNAESFRNIDRQLRTRLTPTQEIRVIITAENRDLLQLPWGLWQFFEDYPRAEPALSLPDYTRSIKTPSSRAAGRVKILAILGNPQGINVARDRQLLEQLPDAELHLLVEPTLEEINQQLWHPGWDLLFFAGHSSSQGKGRLQINRTDSLTLDQLRYGLKRAIAQGLKLAIFNSCDGLGLAWDLADLQIPQVIVMREPVPDRVAQEFLKQFLVAFSDGQPFYLAVREAREKLQGLEAEFLCATWLPTICQNPAELPPTWQEWTGGTGNRGQGIGDRQESAEQHGGIPGADRLPDALSAAPHPLQPLRWTLPWKRVSQVVLSSLVATGLVMGVRSLGVLQPLELWAFDRLLTLRPKESPDARLLIITISEADIQAQAAEQRRGSLSDNALNQLLERLQQYQPRVIGIDIYRDFPTSAQFPALAARLRQTKNLVAICKGRDAKYDLTGIAPPPELSESQVGFSDFLEDDDGVLRRQLISMTPDPSSPCASPYAFSARLAFRYLDAAGIAAEFTPEGNLKLGNAVFRRLRDRAGGYQTIDAQGNQVLLNYRALPSLQAIAPQVSLTQVLNGQLHPSAVKDRMVLIGVTATSSGDVWSTPYGVGTAKKVPGVFIQAQMTSQLLSAVLDRRSLIGVWSLWQEGLWIGAWALIGGALACWRRSLLQRGLASTAVVGTLTGLSLVLLSQGAWVPLIPAGIALALTVSMMSYLNTKV